MELDNLSTMSKNTRNFVNAAVFLITSLFLVPGCTKTSASYNASPITTYVTVINEALYTGPVTVALNDTIRSLQGGFAPGAFSQQYGTLRPGAYEVKFALLSTD